MEGGQATQVVQHIWWDGYRMHSFSGSRELFRVVAGLGSTRSNRNEIYL